MSGLFVSSDWHAHTWPRFASTLPDGRNSRFADLLRTVDYMTSLVVDVQPRAFVVLGDLTHLRRFVQFSVYTELALRLHFIANTLRVQVYLLVGNHDIESHGHHSLGPLRYIENVTVIDTPTTLEMPGGERVKFIPYMQGEQVAHAARDHVEPDVRTVFLHYALDGKVLDSEYALPSALKLSDLDQYERIVLGHVHSPALESSGRVVYVGAPLHFDFGDKGDRYAWHFFDSKLPAERHTLSFPRFVTATYPRVPVCSSELGGFLRVLNVPPDLVNDVTQSAKSSGWTGVITTPTAVPPDAVRAMSREVFVDETAVRAYVDRTFGDSDEPYRTALTEYGVELIRRAHE